jgi:HNH endonuclease
MKRLSRTREEKRLLINRHPMCVYCGCTEYDLLVIDHIHPIVQGGSEQIGNLTISCGKCNSHKWGYTVDEFFDILNRKRDFILNKLYGYVYNLRQLRKGRSQHYSHTEAILIRKILQSRQEHSYFTRIVHSIQNCKYLIFNGQEIYSY